MGEYDMMMGTLLAGIFVNTYLFGIVSYQFGAYFTAGYDDPPWIRVTVGVMLINDSVLSISEMYMAWFYSVTNYNNPSAFGVAPFPYPLTSISTAISAILVHNFLGYRLYRLTEKLWVYIGVMVVATFVLAMGFTTGIRAWILHETSKLTLLTPIIIPWLVGQCSIDLFLSFSLAIVLYRQRTGFKKTDSVINRLIRSSIQIGIFPSIFAIALLACYMASPKTNLYGMFAMPVGRIYTLTLMETLICRDQLKQDLKVDPIDFTGVSAGDREHGINMSTAIWATSRPEFVNVLSHKASHSDRDATVVLET